MTIAAMLVSTKAKAQIAPSPPPVVVDTVTSFNKAYIGRIRGNVSRVTMGHELTANLRTPRGWALSGRLALDESHYRLQDRRDENKNIGVNLSMRLGPRVNLTGRISDNRFFNRVVTFSGDAQNFKNDAQQANARLAYFNTFGTGLQVNTYGQTAITKSQQTFLDDLYQEGALAGGLTYTFGRVSLTGNGFYRHTGGAARASGIEHNDLGVTEDSLGTMMTIRGPKNTNLNAYYHRFSMTSEFMDLPRGVFLESQFNENLVREIETRTAEIFRFSVVTNPTGRVRLAIGGEHSEADSRFVTAFKRNALAVTDGVRATLVYNLTARKSVRVVMDSFDVLHDLGENSLGSYTDRRQNVRADFILPMSDTFEMQVHVGAALFQNFYRDFDVNPRDRDQLDQYVRLRISSVPFQKISAAINLSATQTDIVNISGSLSSNNRQETSFDFRPEFTYQITKRVMLRQAYGLNIEFTDFVFTGDENFLDRNLLFSNTVRAQLTSRLSTVFDYSVLFHDRGSYLAPTPGAERLLEINQEDRRDLMAIDFRYRLNQRLTLLGGYDYTTRRNVFSGGAQSPPFRDGGIEVGAEGNYNFGAGKTLRFRMVKVNRFGQFNSPEQEDYWVADSELNFQF